MDSASAMLTFATNIRDGNQQIDAETASIVESILSMFGGLPEELNGIGKEQLLELISGMEAQIPGLENTSEMTVDQIVKVMRGYLGLDSGDSKGAQVGGDYTGDMVDAISGAAPDVEQAGKDTAETLDDSVNETLGTGKPGPKNRGKYTGQQYASDVNTGVKGQTPTLKTTASTLASDTHSSFWSFLGLGNTGKQNKGWWAGNKLGTSIDTGLGSTSSTFLSSLSDLASGSVSSFWNALGLSASDKRNKGYKAGWTLFNSIGLGSNSMVSSLLAIARSIANSVMSAILAAFGIASPSKFGIGVGKNLASSIGVGWEGNIKDTINSMNRTLNLGTSRLQAEVNLSAAQAQAGASISTTYAPQYNITANRAIGQREILQQIRLDQQRQRLYSV